jgi:hypothetical protein
MVKLHSEQMERASKLIRAMKLPGGTISAEEVARAVWPSAVGPKVARHSRAARLVKSHLVIEVEDPIWRRQLMALSGQILHNLERSLGRGAVQELEFRIAPPRRDAQRATNSLGSAPPPAVSEDEADGIADPVLRSIYRKSRNKALA